MDVAYPFAVKKALESLMMAHAIWCILDRALPV